VPDVHLKGRQYLARYVEVLITLGDFP
jgi:hypothetical protein